MIYETEFLLIRDRHSNERKESLIAKYLRVTQYVSSGFMHSLIIVSFFSKNGVRRSTNFSKDFVSSLM